MNYYLTPQDVGHEFFHNRVHDCNSQDDFLQSLAIKNYQRIIADTIHPCVVKNIIEGRCRVSSYKLPRCRLDRIPKCTEIDKNIRTYDGTCNNFNNPNWGKTNTTYVRMFENCFEDFIDTPVYPISESSKPLLKIIEKTQNNPPGADKLNMLSLFLFEIVNDDSHVGLHCPGKTAT